MAAAGEAEAVELRNTRRVYDDEAVAHRGWLVICATRKHDLVGRTGRAAFHQFVRLHRGPGSTYTSCRAYRDRARRQAPAQSMLLNLDFLACADLHGGVLCLKGCVVGIYFPNK